jgi:hypothetical protein
MDKESQILNVALADYIPVASTEKLDRGGYVSFGEDNLFPQYLRDLAETSPIHGSLCISIGDMIAGSGLKAGSNQGRIEALDLYSVYYSCAHDLKKFGGFFIEVIYSMDRKSIARLKHLPFEECRVAASQEEEEITGVYHSNDWSAPKKKKNKPEFIPIFNPLVNQDEPRQVYFCFNYTSGMIYPRPDYWSAVNYIELSKQIGIFHVNGISNGLFPSVVVSFFNGQLDPDAKLKIMREWENKLSGARNAGKFIMTFDEPGAQRPEITPLPLNDADKLYEYLTNTSRTEVLIAHRVTTPLLFGIRGDGQGFGNNKDELAIGLEIFTNHVIQPAQRKISGAITEIMQFEIPGIEIEVIPNTPLQTQAASVVAPQASAAAKAETPALPAASAQTQAPAPDAPAEDTNVAATALNGAQIASMIEIIIQAASGILPISSAKAIMQASFPTLSSSQIDQIFKDIVPGSVNPEAQAMQALKLAATNLAEESYEPTKEMKAAAERGLAWRDEYGRGGTEIGVARARDISNMRNLSIDTIKRMNSYFSRHAVDKEASGWNQGEEGFPTAGRIAWELWGGDPGADWSARIVERIKKEELRKDYFLSQALISKGEDAPEDWVLIDSYPVNYDEDDEENEEIDAALEVHLAKTGVARPNAKSSQDDKIEGKKYYVRYRYHGEVDDDSREFCRKMIDADKLYRKEDIMMMGKIAVNPGWGARGAATYSIWLYKGGGSCRHVWQKELYISAKGFGLDLTSPFIKQQAWSKANDAGLKIRNNRLVEMMPREMPYRGFLPDNPWFDYSGNPRKKES